VPTTVEAGYPNSSYQFWIGLFAPAKTPRDVVNRLNAEVQKSLQAPSVRERFMQLGVQPMAMGVEQFDKFVKSELALNAELANAAGLVPQ
jgi:tripartite-type tricarboxylate transporter receptor subunit TctC